MSGPTEIVARLKLDEEDALNDEDLHGALLARDAAVEIERLRADIAKYRERLEVDHHYVGVNLDRVDVPYVSADVDLKSYDGIFCRDETIKLLEDSLNTRAQRKGEAR